MMKYTSTRAHKAHTELTEWIELATKTGKSVKHAFRMLKKRFPVLKRGSSLRNEIEASIIVRSCTILPNLCIDEGVIETILEVCAHPQSQESAST